MRALLPLLILAATGCSTEPADRGAPSGSFSGAGRDRLCIAGEGESRRAGIIAYGTGETNCAAAGALTGAREEYTLVPQGEGACRIGLSITGDTVKVTSVPGACAYYCAPGAVLAGKEYRRDTAAKPVTDFAGDPLC